MCNCGNKRNEFTQSLSGTITDERVKSQLWPDASFEYTGNSRLTVTGGITGKKYRFNRTGDVQLIDYRDTSGMMGIPVLRRLKTV